MQIYYTVLHGKQDENEEKNKTVIDSLKKYNRNMLILKIIVVILSLFIMSIWGSFLVERVKESMELKEDYEKGQYIYDIIDEAYDNIENIRKSNNYSISEERTSVSYDFDCVYDYSRTEMSYKDGYFKEKGTGDSGSINLWYNQNHNYTEYGVIAKDKSFNIDLSDASSNASIGISKIDYKYTYNVLEGFHKEDVLEYKYFEIREETIDGKKYYVISKNENRQDGVYNTEIWINKENMQLSKITDEKVGCMKTGQKFTFSVNNVKDEDVRFDFAEENESSRKLIEIFEKINNGELKEDDEQFSRWNMSDDCLKIFFNKNDKTDKKVIMPDEAMDKVIENIKNEYGIEVSFGCSYKGIIFDQNGDAYYAYETDVNVDKENELNQNVFISIFGDTIKINDTEIDIKSGDTVIL